MIYPSWDDVGVPALVLKCLKRLRQGPVLDDLLHCVVFRNRRRVYHTWECSCCGHAYTAIRQHEEYRECEACVSTLISCSTAIAWAKNPPAHLRFTLSQTANLVAQMSRNHLNEFGDSGVVVDCGWGVRGVYCQFQGGDLVKDKSPRLALLRSAILCPYLWLPSDDPLDNWSIGQMIQMMATYGWA